MGDVTIYERCHHGDTGSSNSIRGEQNDFKVAVPSELGLRKGWTLGEGTEETECHSRKRGQCAQRYISVARRLQVCN